MTKKSDWINALNLDEDIAQGVKICGERINNTGVWWQASRNYNDTEVFGCRHAIKYRDRLGSGGNGGIPLWAELKSYVGVAIDSSPETRILFAAHSRANTKFRDDLIIKALGLKIISTRIQKIFDADSTPDPAENEDTKLSEQNCYGRVNPFNIDLIFKEILNEEVGLESIWHIFDESLKLHGGFPNTVMSNLGDRKLAFELHPDDLIDIIKELSPKSIVVKIAEHCPIWLGLEGIQRKDYWLQFPPSTGPKIGILTGNAPESGITLWEDILKTLRNKYEKLPDVLMPEMHIHSLPQMGLSMELVSREKHVWNEMSYAIIALLKVGCKIITLACNTTIYFEPRIIELCDKYNARFVSIAEACMPAIKHELKSIGGGSSVGLVGIGPVVDMEGSYSGYKRHLKVEGIKVTPCPGEKLAFEVKNTGTKDTLVTEFRRLINKQLPNEHVVVLALTEVSMVYRKHIATTPKKHKSDKVFIDPLLELGKYLSFLYLTQGYKECPVCQIPDDFQIGDKLIS